MPLNVSVFTLLGVVFILGVLMVLLQGLRLPKSFFDNQQKRNEAKKQILKNEIIQNEISDDIATLESDNQVN